MTMEECYQQFHGDYQDVLKRLPSEQMVERFALKFLDDQSMVMLRDAIAQKDHKASFRAVHDLKGVTGNLALTPLYQAAMALTSQLRNDEQALADETLVKEVEKQYSIVIKALQAYQANK